ncbi:TetR family transcriptional regulator [Actinoplanes sp. ATCC 53533]|nr:TetR family transcriptional regulator [Actinoplanes sp. ATCC 53533]
MSTADRREMIVAAALPLLMEHGSAVTTLQIARAAGIGEATVFRAFADKDELLNACVAAALRNDHVLAELDAVPLDQPLSARLTEAAATLHAYLHRMGAVIGAVQGTRHRGEPGTPGDRDATRDREAAAGDREPATGNRDAATRDRQAATADRGPASGDQQAATRARQAATGDREAATERTYLAVVRLLEPDRASLRLPAEQLAAVFLGMLFGGRGVPGGVETSIETLVDVFLHGVIDAAAGAE